MLLDPIAFTEKEGGNWQATGKDWRPTENPAAVLFSDGSIYDFKLAAHGHYAWRQQSFPGRSWAKVRVRVKMGRAVQ